MHEDNCFVTLTYDNEHLKSPILDYRDFQLFMKKLRFTFPNKKIGMFVTGEYGEQNKRPHWHAIIFNWTPSDALYSHANHRGDKCYHSAVLDKLWGNGKTEFGSVTLESAGYCARYAAKKLVHGKDEEHNYHPISKKSSKQAIGKAFLEKYWTDIFNYGRCEVQGTSHPIPRYYVKWLKKHHPERWIEYETIRKTNTIKAAQERAAKEMEQWRLENQKRTFQQLLHAGPLRSQLDHKREILRQKFNQLQERLKL